MRKQCLGDLIALVHKNFHEAIGSSIVPLEGTVRLPFIFVCLFPHGVHRRRLGECLTVRTAVYFCLLPRFFKRKYVSDYSLQSAVFLEHLHVVGAALVVVTPVGQFRRHLVVDCGRPAPHGIIEHWLVAAQEVDIITIFSPVPPLIPLISLAFLAFGGGQLGCRLSQLYTHTFSLHDIIQSASNPNLKTPAGSKASQSTVDDLLKPSLMIQSISYLLGGYYSVYDNLTFLIPESIFTLQTMQCKTAAFGLRASCAFRGICLRSICGGKYKVTRIFSNNQLQPHKCACFDRQTAAPKLLHLSQKSLIIITSIMDLKQIPKDDLSHAIVCGAYTLEVAIRNQSLLLTLTDNHSKEAFEKAYTQDLLMKDPSIKGISDLMDLMLVFIPVREAKILYSQEIPDDKKTSSSPAQTGLDYGVSHQNGKNSFVVHPKGAISVKHEFEKTGNVTRYHQFQFTIQLNSKSGIKSSTTIKQESEEVASLRKEFEQKLKVSHQQLESKFQQQLLNEVSRLQKLIAGAPKQKPSKEAPKQKLMTEREARSKYIDDLMG